MKKQQTKQPINFISIKFLWKKSNPSKLTFIDMFSGCGILELDKTYKEKKRLQASFLFKTISFDYSLYFLFH
jgi:hypothetical protein